MRADILKNLVRALVPRPVRNWLRSPSRSAEWLWDATRFSLGAVETFNVSPGRSIVCHPHAYKVACRFQIADPEQSEEFENFLAHCGPTMLLFDLGAHFGLFSLAAALYGGRAVAVDPSHVAAKMMARQVKLNSWADRIKILQAAMSDAPGQLDMLSAGVFSDGYFRLAKGRSPRELSPAKAITIDQMAQECGSPTHIKIDVEGHEAAVLRGGRATLRSASPILFLELHSEMIASDGGDPNAALDELAIMGYGTFSLGGNLISKGEILERPIIRIVAKRVQA
jgi:FkbM family methyltransferase